MVNLFNIEVGYYSPGLLTDNRMQKGGRHNKGVFMHYVVCGSDPGTSNLGVSALGNSAVSSLFENNNSVSFTVLDSKPGIRKNAFHVSNNGGRDITVNFCGAKLSKKFYQKESYIALNLSSKFRGALNKNCQHLLTASAFLDVSGGDSFTDLYGQFRFDLVNSPKYFALKNNIPLILLPQTYGPFKNERTKREASSLVKQAKMAWARDLRSYEILKELLGADFDPKRHKVGVDMAFALPIKEAREKINKKALSWLESESSEQVIGINVSGLIYNDKGEAKNRYGFKADYNTCIEKIITEIIESTNKKIVLIPHVLTSPLGDYESDYKASLNLISNLGLQDNERIAVQESNLDQCEIKWLISKMSWFMGTRMHATIAALSTETPVCTISYSDKALGVFESCGVGYSVIDPRALDTDTVFQQVLDSIGNSQQIKADLATNVPVVRKQALDQLKEIDNYLRVTEDEK